MAVSMLQQNVDMYKGDAHLDLGLIPLCLDFAVHNLARLFCLLEEREVPCFLT
jgi:hypothetical protein